MTHHFRATGILLVAAVVFSLSTASAADILVQHQGNTNPTTEGWSWYTYPGSTTPPTTGSVTNDGGYNARYVSDSSASSGDGGGWRALLSSAQTSTLAASGWSLSMTLKVLPVLDTSVPLDGCVAMAFSDGSKLWQLHFGADTTGRAMVATYASGSAFYTCSSGGYHHYQIDYSPTSHTASVYVDGVSRLSDWAGVDMPMMGFVVWGSAGSGATGRGNWNSVALATVPEPSSLAALSGAILAFAGVLVRRRR